MIAITIQSILSASLASFRFSIVMHITSALVLWLFLGLFVTHNAPGITRLPAVIALAVLYGLLFLASGLRPFSRWLQFPVFVTAVLYCCIALLLVGIFLQATVWDYYQPLSLFDDAIMALAVSWILLIINLLLASLRREPYLLMSGLVAVSAPLFVQAFHLLSDPQPLAALEQHSDLFVGGENGYDIYRIPAMVVLPSGTRLAAGKPLDRDRVLALAEARVHGALDTGAIDLVLKASDDGGKSWGAQRVVCTHRVGHARGKCGNATPVFDEERGTLWLAYNLSGIPGDLPEGPRSHSAHLMTSPDGGETWSEPQRLPFDNMVFGPGHGIQKKLQPARGRLLLPGYIHETSLALYSDDGGESWLRGADLGSGNEAELVELSDGRVYMTTRHVAPIGRPPEPNGRLFALSDDGGESWSSAQLDQALATPVCQASVLQYGSSGTLLFANPAHLRARVRMTVRVTTDNGASWPGNIVVYPGPSGYSQLAALSDGDVLLLYERGRTAYSERISFARLAANLIHQATP